MQRTPGDGGGCAYWLSGQSLESCKLFGRWHLLTSLQVYVEPVAGQLMHGAQGRVLAGAEEVGITNREAPRQRDVSMVRAQEAVARLTRLEADHK